MIARKENGFDMLARLIKQESDDLRGEMSTLGNSLGNRIARLEHKVDSGFARVDQELSSARADIKSLRIDTDELLERTGMIEKPLRLKTDAFGKVTFVSSAVSCASHANTVGLPAGRP